MNKPSEKAKTPREILELFKSKNLPENFCIIPFVNMIFNPTGEVGICRQKGTQHTVGDLENNTIEEIWNNEYMQKWRNEFLTGNVCICKREVEEDFCHLGSTNYEYFNDVKLSTKQELPMKKFTANFNGMCNLECIMCDVWKMPNGFYDRKNFWQKCEKDFFPFIKEVELLSGEPFIQKDTWRLIDTISNLNPNCQWSFTTNSHWRLNNFIKEKLDKVSVKNIHVSIDSLDKIKYSQIRKNGKLETVLENVESLRIYEKERLEKGKSSLGLALHFLVMNENWKELGDILDYVDKMEIKIILDVLKIPQANSVLNRNDEKIIEILDHYFKTLTNKKLKRSLRVIKPLIESLTRINKKIYYIKLQGILSAD